MKTLIRNAAAATLLSAVLASSAFANTATNGSVYDALDQSIVDTTGLNVSVLDGVVTLSGTTNDSVNRTRAAQAAQHADGVTDVVNLITTGS